MCVCVCVSEREGVDKKAARRVVDFVTPPGKKKVVGGWVPRWNVWGQQRVRTRLWRDKVVERTRCDSMCFFSCSLSSLKKKGSTHLSARFSSHLCVGGGVSARFELTPGLFRSSDKPAVHPMCVKGLRFLTVLCGLAASGENPPPPTHPHPGVVVRVVVPSVKGRFLSKRACVVHFILCAWYLTVKCDLSKCTFRILISAASYSVLRTLFPMLWSSKQALFLIIHQTECPSQ